MLYITGGKYEYRHISPLWIIILQIYAGLKLAADPKVVNDSDNWFHKIVADTLKGRWWYSVWNLYRYKMPLYHYFLLF